MKTTLLNSIYFSLILVLFVNCSNSDNHNIEPYVFSGNYTGTFERNGTTSNVQINFTNNTFSGQSETQLFPALCSGTFETTNSTITFQNQCFWTANFDWTLIINDEWSYTFSNNTLLLVKANGDKYTLTPQ
jgi:hypothetical protein